MSASASSRMARRQKCFLCDLPKSSWTILNDFSQPVCRGCVNYEGLDRVEDAIHESRRLRELEGGSTPLGVTSSAGPVTTCGGGPSTAIAGDPTVTQCLSTGTQLDSTCTALPQVDSSNHRTHPSVGAAGPRFEPATPQSTDAVDFMGAAELPGTCISSTGLPTTSIVGSTSAGGNVMNNPAMPTAARADSSGPGPGFDDFPSPMTPYSPDWSGRVNSYGNGGLRVMDTTAGYGSYNPLVAPDYLRQNPYGGYIAGHDSAFTYYGGWRAMKRSGPEESPVFNPYATMSPSRPGSVPPRRMSEPSPAAAAKRLDRGGIPKSPASKQRAFDLTATDNVLTVPASPAAATAKSKDKPGDRTATVSDKSSAAGDSTASAATTSMATSSALTKDSSNASVTNSNSSNGASSTAVAAAAAAVAAAATLAVATPAATAANSDKANDGKTPSSSSLDGSTSTAKADTASSSSNSAGTPDGGTGTRTDVDSNKATNSSGSASAATPTAAQGASSTAETTTTGDSVSVASSSSSPKTSSKPQTQTPPTPAASGDSASAPQKSCNHCGCGLKSVQYVQCPSVERHRYCLFCTYMHIEWSDPGAVSCPSKQRCLHPTSNVPWVFLPNEIESIRKAIQLSETPAIMQ
ncbi:interferon regulatory factor 2-binding protein 2-like [Sycon ciliatum]|uniref:interferon regulatory factor 2-binding protein 2-like n=1 Tax=Sycon ciliatum TaxID=27933 RepID=UPI0031F60E82|eukprot:scpid76237/ scgid29866/ Interferon regulatory factor 2-binding protein-like; Enhanced at puberty protein 1